MNVKVYILLLLSLFYGCNSSKREMQKENYYPNVNLRVIAPKNVSFYIDPNSGRDTNSGLKRSEPWKTFKNVNKLKFSEGNTVEILSPGSFRESLFMVGEGTLEAPITIKFAPGRYDFYPLDAIKRKFHISNTNDAPDSLKAMAFYFLDSKNVKVKGSGAEIVFRGKVIETSINNSENISIQDISFDYKRPTVSEMKVVSSTDNFVDVLIHDDSKFKVYKEKLIWLGEDWKHEVQKLWQVFNPETKHVYRKNLPVEELKFSDLGEGKVRIFFDGNPGFENGMVYQNRNTFRDYCGVFTQNSKNILWKNVTVNFMHGMGFVSQFSENIVFDSLRVGVKEGTGRTCAAWADILHFSGCKGDLVVKNSYLSAANDDAINVHGTHLRIVGQKSNNTIRIKFMHPQTYGFEAFFKGDSIEFINSKTLLPYASNVVAEVNRLNEKEFDLLLKNNLPDDIQEKDVVENSTWVANLVVENTKIESIPTRGILATTRGKVILEGNEFIGTHMSGVLIADDANGWYESGYVEDVTIRNNSFEYCGSPVINIHPENSEVIKGSPVHSNITIDHNLFSIENGEVLSAKSTGGLKFIENIIESKENASLSSLYSLKDCIDVEIQGSK